MPPVPQPVLVVTGAGGIGLAVCRRMGSCHRVLLGHYNETNLEAAVNTLKDEGYDVTGSKTDVCSESDVAALVAKAQEMAVDSYVAAVIHTAGVAASTGTPDRILKTNLLGTTYLIDAFLPLARPGFSLIVTTSSAVHVVELPKEFEQHLMFAPADKLLDRPEFAALGPHVYHTTKRGNVLRVQAAAKRYGEKGARINAVSPGLTESKMGRASKDMAPEVMKAVIEDSALGAMVSTGAVANVMAWLSSADAAFVTGTELLVDAGWVSSFKSASPEQLQRYDGAIRDKA